MDLVGGVPLADGREAKMVTGIDDHSRFIVIAAVVAVPSGRAVCQAFTTAMRRGSWRPTRSSRTSRSGPSWLLSGAIIPP